MEWARRARGALALVGANLVGLAVLAGLGEAGARLTTGGAGRLPERVRGARALWQYDERLGWALRPGGSAETRLENASRPGPDGGLAHVNSLGLRGAEVRQGRTRRALVLGDSFAFGVGVDDDHTLAARLGVLLGPEWEVLNGGVSGYSTDQELLWFERLAGLRPQLVVLVVCDNDFEANTLDAAYEVYRKPVFEVVGDELQLRKVPVPKLTRWERTKRWAATKSYAWGWLRSRRGPDGTVPPGLSWMQVLVPRGTGQNPLGVTTALVEALAQRVGVAGGHLLVMNTGRVGEDRLAIGRLFHRLQGRNGRCLRIDRELQAARAADAAGAWDFGNDSHWNVAAHQLAAELVRAELIGAGWLVP